MGVPWSLFEQRCVAPYQLGTVVPSTFKEQFIQNWKETYVNYFECLQKQKETNFFRYNLMCIIITIYFVSMCVYAYYYRPETMSMLPPICVMLIIGALTNSQ